MNIRVFTDADSESISDLVRNTLLASNAADYDPRVIDQLIKKFSPRYFQEQARNQRILVAQEKNRIQGTARIDGNEIKTVFVHPRVQGQGIGTALMQAAESHVREQGYESAILFSSVTSTAFYEQIGYSPEQQIDDEDYGQVTRMRKSL